MLALKTTKPTWRAGRVIYKLTTSFDECGACQLVGRARPRSKFVDVALGARLTSASRDCDQGRNTSRPLGFSNLKTRLLFLRSSRIAVVGFGHSDGIRQSKLTPNRHQSTVTPRFAKKANEMTSINKDSEILLDRDLDR
ncbi:hypothetical protein TB2_034279 [Malus domestica]